MAPQPIILVEPEPHPVQALMGFHTPKGMHRTQGGGAARQRAQPSRSWQPPCACPQPHRPQEPPWPERPLAARHQPSSEDSGRARQRASQGCWYAPVRLAGSAIAASSARYSAVTDANAASASAAGASAPSAGPPAAASAPSSAPADRPGPPAPRRPSEVLAQCSALQPRTRAANCRGRHAFHENSRQATIAARASAGAFAACA